MRLREVLVRFGVVCALVAPLAILHARAQDQAPGSSPNTDKNSETAAPSDSLAGQFLVASPDIGDPRFDQTVILMVGHDKKGAMGIAINRPVEKHPIAELLRWIGQPDEQARGEVLIYAGGPVEPQIGFIVHSDDYRDQRTLDVTHGVRLTSSPEVLRAMGQGKGPKKALVAFGYSGWGPGQLENEMDRHAWAIAPLDLSTLFDTAPDRIWSVAWGRRIVNL